MIEDQRYLRRILEDHVFDNPPIFTPLLRGNWQGAFATTAELYRLQNTLNPMDTDLITNKVHYKLLRNAVILEALGYIP